MRLLPNIPYVEPNTSTDPVDDAHDHNTDFDAADDDPTDAQDPTVASDGHIDFFTECLDHPAGGDLGVRLNDVYREGVSHKDLPGDSLKGADDEVQAFGIRAKVSHRIQASSLSVVRVDTCNDSNYPDPRSRPGHLREEARIRSHINCRPWSSSAAHGSWSRSQISARMHEKTGGAMGAERWDGRAL